MADVFHPAYELKPKEILRFICAPFVLERQNHLARYITPTRSGSLFVEGKRKVASGSSERELLYLFLKQGFRLQNVLDLFFFKEVGQVRISKELADIPFPLGDWIIREDVPVTQQIPTLEAIIYYIIKRRIVFEEIEIGKAKKTWLVTEVF